MEGRPLEEGELIERAKGGDTAAYSALVKRHQDAAFRTAYVVAGATGDAEDAAQEAFLKAYRALGRFRSGASFRAWLLAIVANEARNRARAAARRTNLKVRLARMSSPVVGGVSGDAAPSPETAAVASDERARILATLNGLEPNDRLVITLRYFLELSEKEMSEVMRCRPGTVKSRLARALGRLRERMEAGVGDA